jgi:hypothetical protein
MNGLLKAVFALAINPLTDKHNWMTIQKKTAVGMDNKHTALLQVTTLL